MKKRTEGTRLVRVKVAGRAQLVRIRAAKFEQALKWLRAGKQVRRRAWHPDSTLFALGSDVYIRLPGNDPAVKNMGLGYRRSPDVWHPYPSDILAGDWVLA